MGRASNKQQAELRVSAPASARLTAPLPKALLADAVSNAVATASGQEAASVDPMLRRSRSDAHDYQANVALSLAKELGRNPRELADAIAAELQASPFLAAVEVAGPGFINLRLRDSALADGAAAALASSRLNVPVADPPLRTVIDYSGPNVAKEMHVGHLRSTIIGDALARTLQFAGHTVHRQNHLGDWGTQFGMLLEQLDEHRQTHPDSSLDFKLLGDLYRDAKTRFDSDPAFADRARQRVVALQSGDEASLQSWQELVNLSKQHIASVYDRLGVTLSEDDIKGESFYNENLPDTVQALLDAGIILESDGALVAYSSEFQGKDGQPSPLLVRKSDGGFMYGTTDLAALQHRVGDMAGERLIYVTDARQAQHFAMVFETAQRAGWLENSTAEHIPFGAVLGEDGTPFKTRDGGTVPLTDLLDEAVAHARRVIDEKNPGMPAEQRAEVAEAVGVGAVKYADLSAGRQRDYVFSHERMLALDGNTAPYLQYAHVRANAIARKAEQSQDGARRPATMNMTFTEPAERELALKALEFTDAVDEVATRLEPHRLCTYLFELAGSYSSFYENCPVLTAPPAQKQSRLALCALTAATLQQGLDLLGIRTVSAM